ncbi:cobyrinate a,c-diamide synthase [Sulfuriflexus sp.]|uniref:cobyrinate a,c-diamide synthase n=1 Tax=Sulfuriflexus sp. TaxID=2015443 RepID=UPI0028CFA3CA|nr:cobyrinate a,c-diamide synthase [Sulfuriflexus sp.]MDT8403988.1 cobyrinate a,c-diamide synthase [Sulfuriflexus sp.]
MPHVLVSAAHKSSGKTTISIGLCAALNARGIKVQPFKKGPDYIDPMWLASASGRDCHNLDFYTMQHEEILDNFSRFAHAADFSLIEGNKGLYDGLDLDGSNSNAALAKLLEAPVILVLDARGMTRGVAPLILGYQAFDTDVQIGGVILNRLGGSRHESKLRRVIEHYTDVPVIGAVHQHEDMAIVERHLGLMPSNEAQAAGQHIANIARHVSESVDLDHLLEIGGQAGEITTPAAQTITAAATDLRIAIARDAAFGFYYAGDLQAMHDAGAELVEFSSMDDSSLPKNIDGLFIGGGFPESCMDRLAANKSMLESIRAAIENGLPVYAECGGLMYLSRSIRWDTERYDMVGVIPGNIQMHAKPQGRGYVRIREVEDFIWPAQDSCREHQAHEFHYSSLENFSPDSDYRFAYEVMRGHGINGSHDGIIYKNMLACYTHQRHVKNNPWVKRFIDFVRGKRNS